MVQPIRTYVTLKFTKSRRKRQRIFSRVVGEYGPRTHSIHAIRLGLSGTVPDFDTLSWHPGNYEIVPEIKKNKVNRFFKTI